MYPEPMHEGLERASIGLGKRYIRILSRTGDTLVSIQGFLLISRMGIITIELNHGTLVFPEKDVRSYSMNEGIIIITLTGESL